jgi:hypothetical protein
MLQGGHSSLGVQQRPPFQKVPGQVDYRMAGSSLIEAAILLIAIEVAAVHECKNIHKVSCYFLAVSLQYVLFHLSLRQSYFFFFTALPAMSTSQCCT